MAKNPNYSDEKVYNILHQRFPSIFQRLAKVPEPLPNPGDQPRRPIGRHRADIQINPSDTFETLCQKIFDATKTELAADRETLHFSLATDSYLQISREIIQDHSMNEDIINNDDDCTEAAYYGEVNVVRMRLIYENPNYHRESDEYRIALRRWEDKTRSRQERNEKIKAAENNNKTLIHAAKLNQRELWIAAGRELRNGVSEDLLQMKKEALLRELAEIESKLTELPSREEV